MQLFGGGPNERLTQPAWRDDPGASLAVYCAAPPQLDDDVVEPNV